jgi:energy-coupling factor transporter ATP-binding protein EcfA2
MFDLPPVDVSESEFHVEIPDASESWNVGLIVGPSGSGKSTIARQAFGDKIVSDWNWPENQSVLDGFPAEMGITEITGLLSSVGFSSPPAWLRPFAALSTGQQFRVNVARSLAEMPELAVIDEFTSVVDRTVARIGSASVARAVRNRNQKFVAVTCHYDIADWLQPDWIVDMADGSLARRFLQPGASTWQRSTSTPQSSTSTGQRPQIHIEISRCKAEAWKLFERHHYLSSNLHASAKCFLGTIEGTSAVFVAALPFPHPTHPGWREHRCVCLPDFQGLGIGNAVSEFVASLFAATGKRYTGVTSHPAMIRHRLRSRLWRMIRGPSRARSQRLGNSTGMSRTSSCRRMTASFAFVGSPKPELARHFGIAIQNQLKPQMTGGPALRADARRLKNNFNSSKSVYLA